MANLTRAKRIASEMRIKKVARWLTRASSVIIGGLVMHSATEISNSDVSLEWAMLQFLLSAILLTMILVFNEMLGRTIRELEDEGWRSLLTGSDKDKR